MSGLLCDRYKVELKLGNGSFGRVYRAVDTKTGVKYAIKVEKVYDKRNTMKRELEVYSHINGAMDHIPRIELYARGQPHRDGKGAIYYHQYMIMELLGKSLSGFRDKLGGKVPWALLSRIAMQTITLTQQLHSQGYVHRDIKPDNFVLGLGKKKGVVYMLDFGLSRKWEDLIDKYTQNDESSSSSSIVGTARYMSINVHKGKVYGWRDDMESLGYVYVYLLTGSLPWQGQKAATKRLQMKRILQLKERSKETMCKDIPGALAKYLDYCWNLELGTQPDYRYLWELFKSSADSQ
jgi:casein kinase I family protein HRR25